ncbi:MAG: hypothetical protein E6G36_14330 [Actinobacteria bacterium]|nr:MAG: hypothetical protein E6G36_14330 [Actinomycetota bacterium]
MIVGAGDEPSLVLAVGARKGGASYPFDETAARRRRRKRGRPTSEAYAKYSKPQPRPAPELS